MDSNNKTVDLQGHPLILTLVVQEPQQNIHIKMEPETDQPVAAPEQEAAPEPVKEPAQEVVPEPVQESAPDHVAAEPTPEVAPEPTPAPKKRGRPPGACNRFKVAQQQPV